MSVHERSNPEPAEPPTSIVHVSPDELRGEVANGTSLLDALTSLGIHLTAPCGGEGTCGKCRVRARGALSPITDSERHQLGARSAAAGFRLACQARVQGDVHVTVPAISRRPEMRIVLNGTTHPIELEPAVQKQFVPIAAQTLGEPYSRLEHLRRCGDLPAGLHADLGVLQRLPAALDSCGSAATAVLCGDRLLDVEPGDTTEELYGVAVDLGTTTVVASLVDLRTGRELAHAATVNQQTQYGHDVVSRIHTTIERQDGLQVLQAAAHASVARVVQDALESAGVPAERLYDATLVGNATMMHLCLGIAPGSLGRLPYVATVGHAVVAPVADVGFHGHPEARVYVLPNIAGFVGADTVGAILAAGLDRDDGRIRLLADIGTNCEIALRLGDRLLVTSTPAGPAFEGARIACGMYAAPGAIEKVRIDGQIHWQTIGRRPPLGLCGSGLIDISAELVRLGVVDATGRMLGPDELDGSLSAEVRAALVEREDGVAFVIASGSDGSPILLTQRDVRELQLAKGAIRSGIDLLLEHAGLAADRLDEFVVAGGFGSYIDKENAMRLGMVPRLDPRKLTFIGNGALVGARLALVSRSLRRRGEEVARQAAHLQLAHTADFQTRFSEAMLFDS